LLLAVFAPRRGRFGPSIASGSAFLSVRCGAEGWLLLPNGQFEARGSLVAIFEPMNDRGRGSHGLDRCPHRGHGAQAGSAGSSDRCAGEGKPSGSYEWRDGC
jgi:hypothetical protein